MKTALRWLLQVSKRSLHFSPVLGLSVYGPGSWCVRCLKPILIHLECVEGGDSKFVCCLYLRNSHFPFMSYRRSLAQDPDSRLVTLNQGYSLTAPEFAFYELLGE